MVNKTALARLVDKVDLSEDICSLTFEAVDARFENCEAGAHLDVHLTGELIRNYSLTDWDPAGKWVTIAVKVESGGRGGSSAMHRLVIGQTLGTTGPRNNFPLAPGREPIVLIGGGIGITPIYAMARALQSAGRPFELHYLVRAQSFAAFDAALSSLDLAGGYHLHCDEVHGMPDFMGLVEKYPVDSQYYVCGPEVMLNAVQAASQTLGKGVVFFERFSALAVSHERADEPFRVALRSTGEELEVPSGKSVLQVLRAAGHDVDYSCSEGTCGTCIIDVLEGDIDHRDSILTEEEKVAGDCMCVCVSRANCARLLLDL